MSETRKGFVQLHLSVLLAGFTGLFGRLITLNEVDIVWYRMLFTSAILLVFTGLPKVGWRKFLQLCGCGALLGFHWILFYGSIKASNVSIGVICFSLIGFFTAIFEPMIYKRKLSWLELLFSLITANRSNLFVGKVVFLLGDKRLVHALVDDPFRFRKSLLVPVTELLILTGVIDHRTRIFVAVENAQYRLM